MMRRFPLILNSILFIFFFSAPMILADGTGDTTKTMVEMSLTGPDQSYRLYLPAPGVQPVTVYSGTVSNDFNHPGDQIVLDFPVRVSWEMTVSDNDGGKDGELPQLLVSNSDLQTPEIFVSQSFRADTRYGSFILPSHTGMMVQINTGSWQKRSGLFSSHAYGYECKVKLSYQIIDDTIPLQFVQVNTAIVNNYINRMIISHEKEIKTAIINENLYDLAFHKIDFRIESGELNVAFTAYYQGKGFLGIPFKTEASGTVAFEVRLSDDGTRIGLYGKGLVGKFDVARDLGLLDAWGRSYINQKIAGHQFWSGGENPAAYLVFKTENLARVINQAMLSDKFKPLQYEMMGGLAQIHFINIEFQEINLAEGRAEARCQLSITGQLLGKEFIRLDDAGSVDFVKLIFYIDSDDQTWWIQISDFHATLNGFSPTWNSLVNNLISKKLAEHGGLIPLNIPGSNYSGD